MLRHGTVEVESLKEVQGFSDVSWAQPVYSPNDVDLILVEVDENDAVMDIVDGFHRANGFAAGGLESVPAILCRAETDEEDDLIAAAAVPEGYNGMSQIAALAEIYERAQH